MKHIITAVLLIFVLFWSSVCVRAEQVNMYTNNSSIQQKVLQVGFRLLNGSLCEKRVTFFYENSVKPKLKINNRSKRITVTNGLFPFIDNDDELAGVLSLGIAKLTDSHDGFFRRFSMSFSPRKYEVKSDKKAVDIMVKAGYNPIGLINIITKLSKENNWFEYNVYNHNGSERLAYIYQYIYEKYPVFISENEYLKEYSYQNFLVTSKKERKKVRLLKQYNLSQHNKHNKD